MKTTNVFKIEELNAVENEAKKVQEALLFLTKDYSMQNLEKDVEAAVANGNNVLEKIVEMYCVNLRSTNCFEVYVRHTYSFKHFLLTNRDCLRFEAGKYHKFDVNESISVVYQFFKERKAEEDRRKAEEDRREAEEEFERKNILNKFIDEHCSEYLKDRKRLGFYYMDEAINQYIDYRIAGLLETGWRRGSICTVKFTPTPEELKNYIAATEELKDFGIRNISTARYEDEDGNKVNCIEAQIRFYEISNTDASAWIYKKI